MVDHTLPTEIMSAEEVKTARRELNVSVTELARAMNISSARTVRRWESDEVPVSGPSAVLMRLFLEVPGAFEYAQNLSITRK